MKNMYNREIFLFIYHGIADRNPNSGHDIEQFWRGQFVAAEFSTYASPRLHQRVHSATTLSGNSI